LLESTEKVVKKLNNSLLGRLAIWWIRGKI
jgi:hypothetical protein